MFLGRIFKFGVIAQLVEQKTENLRVAGSIPANTASNLGESPSGKASDFDSDIRRFDPFLLCQVFACVV